MRKMIRVYAGNCSELAQIAERYVTAYGATGWARCETSKQGAGEYLIVLKDPKS